MNLPSAVRWMMRAGADIVGGIVIVHVIGAFIGMALGDIDVPLGPKPTITGCHSRRWPLSSTQSPRWSLVADGHQAACPRGDSFITVAWPLSVIQTLSSLSTAMPCALAWWPITLSGTSSTSLWSGVELHQLHHAGGAALEHPQIALGIQRHRRNAADALGHRIGIGEVVAHGLVPLDAGELAAFKAMPAAADDGMAALGAAIAAGHARGADPSMALRVLARDHMHGAVGIHQGEAGGIGKAADPGASPACRHGRARTGSPAGPPGQRPPLWPPGPVPSRQYPSKPSWPSP